jgi:hypothetical protein
MVTGIEDIQKLGKSNVDVALKSAGVVSKALQQIAAESADYTKKSFDAGAQAFERFFAVRSLDKAVEVHSDYVKSAYEGYVGQVTRMGEIFADMAKDAYKPYEGLFGKFPK